MPQDEEDGIPLLGIFQQEDNDRTINVGTDDIASPNWTPTEIREQLTPKFYTPRLLCAHLVCCLAGLALTKCVWQAFAYDKSIAIFLGTAMMFVCWVALRWYAILAVSGPAPRKIWRTMGTWRRYKHVPRFGTAVTSALALWLVFLSVLPVRQLRVPAVTSANERYFIAINLYNNANIMPGYTRELLALIEHREWQDNHHLVSSVTSANLRVKSAEQ